jgi:hypothetical protein
MSDGQSNTLAAASMVLSVVGIVLGIGGIVASWYFYRKARHESDAAIKQQREVTNIIARKLQDKKLIDILFDQAGNAVGNSFTMTLRPLRSPGTLTTRTPETTTGEPPQYDRQHEQPPLPDPEGDHA